jgi:hypothetical protein
VELIREAGNRSIDLHLLSLDLASLDSVRRFATAVKNISEKVKDLLKLFSSCLLTKIGNCDNFYFTFKFKYRM